MQYIIFFTRIFYAKYIPYSSNAKQKARLRAHTQ